MARFVIYRDRAGQYRWRLVAKNGEIVAISEAYTAKNPTQKIKKLPLLLHYL